MTSESQTQFIYIPDHKARSVALLLWQFKKPRIMALVEALAQAAQTQEDDTFSLIVSRTLTAATGANLDQWGELVGEPRGGLSDNQYRRFISARLLANRSQGNVDQLIQIFELVTGALKVTYKDLFPAGFTLYAYTSQPLADGLRERVRRMMYDIKPAGVSMELIEAPAGYFGFLEDKDAEGYNRGVWARLI